MSTPTDPRREHPSTYLVQDRSNEEELARLLIQDQLVTAGMGGVLPEQSDPSIFQRVLDVGCGTGGWLIEAAKTYPSMSLLVGVDVSERMVEYAGAQAAAQQVGDRVQFRAMDALRMLEFPSDYFNLVNQRFGASYLRTWDWPKLLSEYLRVTRPGGVIRVTEGNMIPESTSPTLTRLFELFLHAGYQAGHNFVPESNGLTSQLVRLLRRAGIQNVQTQVHKQEYRAGTTAGQLLYDDLRRLFRTILPFLRKWSRVPEDYETLYHQALSDMEQPDFMAIGSMLTAWGNKPPKKEQGAPVPE